MLALAMVADAALAAQSARAVAESLSAAQLLNLLAGLVVVLLVFFALVFLLKKISGFNGTQRGHMTIIDALHLGTRERLLIVRVTGRHFLLGVSPQGIHALQDLGAELAREDAAPVSEARGNFAHLLSKLR